MYSYGILSLRKGCLGLEPAEALSRLKEVLNKDLGCRIKLGAWDNNQTAEECDGPK